MGNSTGRGSHSRFRKGGCSVRGWTPGLYRKFLKENNKQTQIQVGYFIAASPIFSRPYTFFFFLFSASPPSPPFLLCFLLFLSVFPLSFAIYPPPSFLRLFLPSPSFFLFFLFLFPPCPVSICLLHLPAHPALTHRSLSGQTNSP